MWNKIMVMLLFGIMFISLGSAIEQDLGTGVKGNCMNIIQTCDTCSYNNVTRILFPNSTEASGTEIAMNSSGIYYNHTFCSTGTIGEYVVLGHGDLDGTDTVWTYTFDITGKGESISVAKSIMYIGLLIILVILLVVCVLGISTLPGGNNKDEETGVLLSINKLKYFRGVLMLTSWMILMSLMFTASNIGLAYFEVGMFGNLFLTIYKIMMSLTLPIVVLWFVWIFINIYQDNEFKKMLERGIEWGNKP